MHCNGIYDSTVGSWIWRMDLFHTLLQLIISLLNILLVYKSQSCLYSLHFTLVNIRLQWITKSSTFYFLFFKVLTGRTRLTRTLRSYVVVEHDTVCAAVPLLVTYRFCHSTACSLFVCLSGIYCSYWIGTTASARAISLAIPQQQSALSFLQLVASTLTARCRSLEFF
jgi:hypothetical protein